MLDADEHRSTVRRESATRDLAVGGASQKPSRVACCNVTGQHLVVADACKLTLVHLRGMGIGLYPQHATRIKHNAVGAAIDVAFDIAASLCASIGRVACQYQVVPAETCTIEVTFVFPPDDLAHRIVSARIRRIDTRLVRLAAGTVIGQRAVNPAILRIDGEPLGTVHFRSLQNIAGLARFNQNLTLIDETVASRQWSLTMYQWQPLTPAIRIEFSNIQNAMVKQFPVGLRLADPRATGRNLVSAHKFVDVLKAGIFA